MAKKVEAGRASGASVANDASRRRASRRRASRRRWRLRPAGPIAGRDCALASPRSRRSRRRGQRL